MALVRKKKKVTRQSDVGFAKNRDDDKTTKEVIKEVVTDGTQVETALGTTLSKSYNSVRIDVAVRFPTTKRGYRRALEEAWDLCGEELYAQIKQAKVLLNKL